MCYYYYDGMVQTLNPQDTVTPSLEPGREEEPEEGQISRHEQDFLCTRSVRLI
jgi:hypothetical protein